MGLSQINIQTRSSFRKSRAFLKKATSRKTRREAKRNLDINPRRGYQGWVY